MNRPLGRQGEETAVAFLRRHRYRILERNYRTKVGEADIVARRGRTLFFIEVKTRTSDRFGLPEESVTPRRISRLRNCARVYLLQHKIDLPVRFAVVGILQGPAGADIRVIPVE